MTGDALWLDGREFVEGSMGRETATDRDVAAGFLDGPQKAVISDFLAVAEQVRDPAITGRMRWPRSA